MQIRMLEHINIRTTRIEETIRFYTDVLGLRTGPYPKEAPFRGAWVYDGNDIPVLHLVDVDPFDAELMKRIDALLTFGRPVESLHGTGAIDHVAFQAEDYQGFVRKFQNANIRYKTQDIVAGLRQLFVIDPNGVVIELNFRELVAVA